MSILRNATSIILNFSASGTFLVVVFLFLSGTKGAEEDDTIASPANVEKFAKIFVDLEKDYASINGSGKVLSVGIKGGIPTGGFAIDPFDFSRIPNRLRVDRKGMENHRPGGEIVKGLRGSMIINKDSSFDVYKPKEGGPYLIENLKASSETTALSLTQKFRWYFDCPYGAGPLNLAKIFDRPDWKMYEPKEIALHGRKLIRIRFARSSTNDPVKKVNPSQSHSIFTVLIDPELNNVVHAYTMVTRFAGKKPKIYLSGLVEYERNVSEPPVPKKLVSQDFYESDDGQKYRLADGQEIMGVRRDECTVTIDHFDFIPRSPGDFELTAFNLPDLTKSVVSTSPSIGAGWLFVGAGIALALAVGFHIYAAKRRNLSEKSHTAG